jgi:hypothetical protein
MRAKMKMLHLAAWLLLPVLDMTVNADDLTVGPLHGRLAEAVQSQKALRNQLIDGLSFNYLCNLRIEPFDKPPSVKEFERACVYSYPCMAIEDLRNSDPKRARTTVVIGKSYAFELASRSSTTDWFVKDIGLGDPKDVILRGRFAGLHELGLDELFLETWLPILDIEGIPVDRFFSLQGMVIDKVEDDGNSRVAITFHGAAQVPTGYDRVVEGTVWLDPGRSWVVDEYDVKIDSRSDNSQRDSLSVFGRAHRKVEWSRLDGLPVPTSITVEYTGNKDARLPKVVRHVEYGEWTLKRHGDERFQMSHYGLPEPGIAKQSAGQAF